MVEEQLQQHAKPVKPRSFLRVHLKASRNDKKNGRHYEVLSEKGETLWCQEYGRDGVALSVQFVHFVDGLCEERSLEEEFIHDEAEGKDVLFLAVLPSTFCLFAISSIFVSFPHLRCGVRYSKPRHIVYVNFRLPLGQSSRWYAEPKSTILGMSGLQTTTLAGLRSRWTISLPMRNRTPWTR